MAKKTSGVVKRFIALLNIFILFAFCGCAYSNNDMYMNFLADLDLMSRMDLMFDAVENGKTDLHTQMEIEIIRNDIASFNNSYEEAIMTNDCLDLTAQLLLDCIDFYKSGDIENYESSLKNAKKQYATAKSLISSIRDGAENV